MYKLKGEDKLLYERYLKLSDIQGAKNFLTSFINAKNASFWTALGNITILENFNIPENLIAKETLIIKYSRLNLLSISIISFALALGLFYLNYSEPNDLIWLFNLLAALLFVTSIYFLYFSISNNSLQKISKEGIKDFTKNKKVVPWEDVIAVYHLKQHYKQFTITIIYVYSIKAIKPVKISLTFTNVEDYEVMQICKTYLN